MSMTQTLKTFFSKKTKPLKQVKGSTDAALQDRSAVLDLSSKAMSRIASITLFCFLSQTFAQTLYAATEGLKGLHVHLQPPVNLASLPTFSLSGTFSGADDTASGFSSSPSQSQPRTTTDRTNPVSSPSSQDKQTVEQVLYQSCLGDTPIDKIKGEKQHGRGLSTRITKEKDGFKLEVGHQNNLLLSAFIGFSGQMSVTHSALTDALSLSVKSYATVHFDTKNAGVLGHVSVDAKNMQVTGYWHADSLTTVTKRFSVKDKSTLFVHETAKLTSDVMITKGATLNAKDLTVEAFEIDNENGTLGGMDAATITLKKRPGSTFQNKDGKIGSGKRAVFNIEEGYAIKHLGTLQGEDVSIRHNSSDAVLDLAEGVVQASKRVSLYGSTLKGRVSETLGVRFETPLLWIDAKDFDLLPQTAVNLTQVYLMGQKNFHLTHDYKTAQKFSVTEHNFITKGKAQEGVKQPRVLSGKDFHIDAVVQAKSMDILTPSYTGVVGLEDGANSKRGELLTEEGHLDVVAHDFDLQNATIAADSGNFIVREPLKVGRLVRDLDHTIFGTIYKDFQTIVGMTKSSPGLYANAQQLSPLLKKGPLLGLESAAERKRIKKLRTVNDSCFPSLPITAASKHHNQSGIFIKTLFSIQGDFVLNGNIETQDLVLKGHKSSIHSGKFTVSRNAHVKGDITLTPEFDNGLVLNQPPEFYVGGELKGSGTVYNTGSIFHAKKTSGISYNSENFISPFLQQALKCCEQDIDKGTPSHLVDRVYDLVLRTCSVSTNNTDLINIKRDLLAIADHGWFPFFYYSFSGIENIVGAKYSFPAQTSFGDSVFLPEATHLSGHISAPNLLITASPQGLVVGTKNPYYVPPKPAVAMFHMRDLQAVAGANLHMNQIPGVHLSNAFRFYFQERFWHKEDEAQAFYDRVRQDIHIITKDHKIKPYQGQVIKMTPQLILDWLKKKVQDTLMRGYIEPEQAVDFALLAELHQNGTEYLRRTGLGGDQAETLAMTVYGIDPTNRRIPLPDKPMIFYLMDETDPHKSLMPNIYFPKDLRDGARSDRGGLITANNFMVLPYNMTGDQFLCLASHRPELMGLASSAPALIAHFNRDVSADQPAITTPANTEIHSELRIADILIALASGNLTVNAKIQAEKALFASLEGNVTFETAIKRIGHGDRWEDVVASTADITTRGMLAVLAPKGIVTVSGAKLTSTDSKLAIMGRHVLLKSVGLQSHRAEMWHRHYEEENNLRQLQSSIKGEEVTVMALDTLMTAGVIAESGSLGTTLQGGDVIQQGTYNTRQTTEINHHRRKTTYDNRQTCIALPDEMKSEGNITIVSLKAPLTVVGTKYTIPANKKVMITTRGGAQFLAAWSQDIHQVANAYKGFAKITYSGYTEQSQAATPVTVSGGGTMEITMVDEDGNALSNGETAPIKIEVPEGVNLDQITNLSWVTDVLKAHPETELTRVRNEQGKVEYRVTAMSPQLTMVIALAVAVCTGGAGLAGMLGVSATTMTGAMAVTATSALITQTITATAGYAMGDRKAFAKAVSEDKLKSVGIDVVCAGLTQGITNGLNTGSMSILQAACLRTAVRELKVVAQTGKWDVKGCLGREVTSTIEGAAQSLVQSIGDQYSNGNITSLEHKIQHGLTAGMAEGLSGLAESAITGQKVQGLLERSVAAGAGAVLAESVAEALYNPQDLLPPEEMSALKKEAVQNAQTKLGENANPQKLAEETIRQFGVLFQSHQNNHLENTRKIALLTNIAVGALANNPDVLQAMHRAAERALTHNFMEGAKKQAAQVWEKFVRGIEQSAIAKNTAMIMLARAGIQIINVLPCGRVIKGGQYIYKIGNIVRTFNKIEDAIRFVNTEVAGATQIVGTAYTDLVTFGEVLEREGIKAAGARVYTGCENWIKDNITQGLDVDGSAALDHERFKAYDGPQESTFEKKSAKESASASTPQQSSSASTGGAMPPPEDEDDKGKFKENKLTEKQKQQLEGKKLEGENPGNVAPGNRGFTNVDTEKLGGLEEAKRTFEGLTGEKVPEHLNKPGDMHYKILPNGNRIQIRFEGDSGHPKIDITDKIQKILEKVSFK